MSEVVSALIVNWNGGAHLATCLESLAGQTYTSLEVVVIDNASTDGSTDDVTTRFPDVRLVCNRANVGLCAALNQGLALTAGSYVLALNPDVCLTSNFLTELVRGLEAEGAGSATGKLLRPATGDDGRSLIDSTGLLLNRWRRPADRGRDEEDKGQYDAPGEVFGACGAAALHRRAMLADIAVGGRAWDEGLFAYYDDVDIAWRARLRGWRCVYVPSAVAYHDRAGSETLRKRARAPGRPRDQALAIANRYRLMIKNESWATLLPDFPFIIASDLPRWLYLTLRAPRLWAWASLFWRGLPEARAARREIQARRRTSWSGLRRWFR
ncbi:MAG: glycosyltransferase family 2 protein [Anaerolineae bacterium]|nr:glycosyltransferase family 2 protein [Anaerolineae bacterium]